MFTTKDLPSILSTTLTASTDLLALCLFFYPETGGEEELISALTNPPPQLQQLIIGTCNPFGILRVTHQLLGVINTYKTPLARPSRRCLRR